MAWRIRAQLIVVSLGAFCTPIRWKTELRALANAANVARA
jgi:hypothetical protein